MTSIPYNNDEERQLAILAAKALSDIKANDIRVIDLRDTSPFTDYFVIASGTTPLHMRALADRVAERLRKAGIQKRHCEGRDGERWILMDYFNVVVHIFSENARQYYGLERLWGDTETIDWEETAEETADETPPALATSTVS